jgi:hypothetical protein
MDDFSILTGLLGYLDSTQEVELESLHAQTMSFYYWICTFDQNFSFLWGKFI